MLWYRDDATYDILVKDMINGDFAMKALLENAELFVFTSYILPWDYQSEPSIVENSHFLRTCIVFSVVFTVKLCHKLIALQGFNINIICGGFFGQGKLYI